MSRKLTNEQRQEIIDAYLSRGYLAAHRAGAKYSVGPNYVKNLRFRRGLPKAQRKTLPETPKQPEDHRWQWAIERGAIIA